MTISIRKTIFLIGILLFTSIKMEAQNEHFVIVEDQILVAPEHYTVKVSTVSNNILSKDWMKQEGYLSKELVLELINDVEHVKIVDNIKSKEQEFIDIWHVQVKGKTAYQQLRKKLKGKAALVLESTHVNNYSEYENNLTDKLLKQAKTIAIKNAITKGKQINRLITYEEVEDKTELESTIDSESMNTSFATLKEKFIEYNHQGHIIDDDGNIVLKKKIKVSFEIE